MPADPQIVRSELLNAIDKALEWPRMSGLTTEGKKNIARACRAVISEDDEVVNKIAQKVSYYTPQNTTEVGSMLVAQARKKLEDLLDLAKAKALEQFDSMSNNLGGLFGANSGHCNEEIGKQAVELRVLAEQTYLKAVCHECCCSHDHH